MKKIYAKFMDMAKEHLDCDCDGKCDDCPFGKDIYNTDYTLCDVVSNFYADNRDEYNEQT